MFMVMSFGKKGQNRKKDQNFVYVIYGWYLSPKIAQIKTALHTVTIIRNSPTKVILALLNCSSETPMLLLRLFTVFAALKAFPPPSCKGKYFQKNQIY